MRQMQTNVMTVAPAKLSQSQRPEASLECTWSENPKKYKFFDLFQ